MKKITMILTSVVVTILLPNLVFANSCGHAESFCKDTSKGIKDIIAESNCKSDANCEKCVGDALGGSQVGTYCSAYESAKKSKNKQIPAAVLYDASAAVCLTSCVLQKSVYPATVVAGEALVPVCKGLGIGAAAWDFVSAIIANDPTGMVMGAVGVGMAAKNSGLLASGTKAVADTTKSAVTTKSNGGTCVSGVIFTALAVVKHISLSKMNKAKKEQCDVIDKLSETGRAASQSCGGLSTITSVNGTGQAGTFSVTNETFSNLTPDGAAVQLGATASDDAIRGILNDAKGAAELAKINLPEFARRADEGASASDLINSSGLPGAEMASVVKEVERQVQAGNFKYLNDLAGGYNEGKPNPLANAGGNSEMTFGSSGVATPGESTATLDIDRKPANEMEIDGDIFHGAYSGSIFDIVTHRVKAQKGNYAELIPEGRMNRLYNGYGDSKSRKPASKK